MSTTTKKQNLTDGDFMKGYYENLKEVIEAIETGEVSEDLRGDYPEVIDLINACFLEIDNRALVMTTGGPHVEICLNCQRIEAYWGNDRGTWHLLSSEIEILEAYFEELGIF